jgi:hypothetical protein
MTPASIVLDICVALLPHKCVLSLINGKTSACMARQVCVGRWGHMLLLRDVCHTVHWTDMCTPVHLSYSTLDKYVYFGTFVIQYARQICVLRDICHTVL